MGIAALEGEATASPITSILGKLCDEGGFSKTLAVITITSSMAAVMSTADSLLIAISQLITVEVAYPLWPDATQSQIAWIGRGCSLFSTVFALVVGLLWGDGIADLAITQIDLSLQAIPAFWWGLFAKEKTDVHPWCLCIGCTISTVYVVCFNYLYVQRVETPLAINAGVTGFVMQVAIVAFAEFIRRTFVAGMKAGTKPNMKCNVQTAKQETSEAKATTALLFPNRPPWDIPEISKFGVHSLSPRFMWRMMEGVSEPLTIPSWLFFLLFFCITMTTPMVPEMSPEQPAEAGVVNGLPWWVFKSICLSLVPQIVFLVALFQTSNCFPGNDAVDDNNSNGVNDSLEEDLSLIPSEQFNTEVGAVLEEKSLGLTVNDDEDGRPILRRRRSIRRILAKYGVPQTVIDHELSFVSHGSKAVAPQRIGSGVLLDNGKEVEIAAYSTAGIVAWHSTLIENFDRSDRNANSI